MTNKNSNSDDRIMPKDFEASPIPPVSRKHDLFQDPALSKSLDEDPIANFIISNWKNVFVVILAVFGGFYLWNQIQATKDTRIAEASETFDAARSSVVRLIENQKQELKLKKEAPQPNPTVSQDEQKLLRSAKDSLNSLSSGPEPYALLAPFYENLLNSNLENEPSKSAVTGATENKKFAWYDTKSDDKRLVLELSDLSYSRLLLDKDESFKEGVSRLQRLAKEGLFVGAPAVLTLLRVVESAEDKSSAVALAQEIIQQNPETASKIDPELKRLL